MLIRLTAVGHAEACLDGPADLQRQDYLLQLLSSLLPLLMLPLLKGQVTLKGSGTHSDPGQGPTVCTSE